MGLARYATLKPLVPKLRAWLRTLPGKLCSRSGGGRRSALGLTPQSAALLALGTLLLAARRRPPPPERVRAGPSVVPAGRMNVAVGFKPTGGGRGLRVA